MEVPIPLQIESKPDLEKEVGTEGIISERTRPSLRAIANTLQKLLIFIHPNRNGLGGSSTTPVTELEDNFSIERKQTGIKSSWRHRSTAKNKTRKNLKSGITASARSTSSLFSRSSAFNKLINNNGNNNNHDNDNYGKNGRPSLSLTTSFDYSSEQLFLPGRFVSMQPDKESDTGKDWTRLSSVDC